MESTFSVMTTIVTKQTFSFSMSVPVLNAIQVIKHELMATKLDALRHFDRSQPT